MKSNQQRGKCPLCSQSTKVVTNLRLAQPHIVAYIQVAHRLKCLRDFLFLGWLNSQKPTVRWQRINSEHVLSDKFTMQCTACQYNISQKGLATYVVFCDFSIAFPSIHWDKFLSLLCKENFVGRMWKHLRERFRTVKVCVLHPRIPKSSSVDILRGVPEGSRLRPTLFGIFVADLIHELKVQFPNHHPLWGGQVDRGNSFTLKICVWSQMMVANSRWW